MFLFIISFIVATCVIFVLLIAAYIGLKFLKKRWIHFDMPITNKYPVPYHRREKQSVVHNIINNMDLYYDTVSSMSKHNRLPIIGDSDQSYKLEYEKTLKIVNAALTDYDVNFMFIKFGRGKYSSFGSDIDLMVCDYSETPKIIECLASLQYIPYHLSVDDDPFKITFYNGPPESSIAVDIYQELELGRFYLFTKSIIKRNALFLNRHEVLWKNTYLHMPEDGVDLFINIVHDFGHRKVSLSGIGRSLDILLNNEIDWQNFIELIRKTNLYGPALYYLCIIDAYSNAYFGKFLIPNTVINTLLSTKIGLFTLKLAKKTTLRQENSFPLFLVFYDFFYQTFFA